MPLKRGDLTLTVGSSSVEVMVPTDKNGLHLYTRTPAAPLNPIINTTGLLDYASNNPEQGIPLGLDDFSGGCGAFLHEPGRYAIGINVDCRRQGVVLPGPPQTDDLTGMATHEKVIKRISVGGVDNWVITSTTAYKSAAGTGAWTQVGANGTGWTVGTPTDIVAFGLSGANPVIAVAMGSATKWQYTVDNGANWVVNTKIGNAAYANRFCVASADDFQSKVWYAQNPNRLFATDDLTSAASDTGSLVGDATNDEFNSIEETDEGTLLMGKRRFLFSIDSAGKVKTIAGPFRYRATSDVGLFTSAPTRVGNQNFENPTRMPDGSIVYTVEEYRLIQYDHGTLYVDIQPATNGPQILLLQAPISAHCCVGEELWVSLASKNLGTLKSAALVPGRTALIANDISSYAGTLLYAGNRQPDGTWVWHGALRVVTGSNGILRYLWYDGNTSYLYGALADDTASDTAQQRMYVPIVDPLSAKNPDNGTIYLTTDVWHLETGLFVGGQPNLIKTLRYGSGRMRVGTPTLLVRYRTASDDTATGYSTLATYTTPALAATGTAFPASTTFNGVRFLFTSGGTATGNDYALLFNFQFVYLTYPPRYDKISFTVSLASGQRNNTGAMSTMTAAQFRTFLDAWKDAQTPATVKDNETGDTWSMDLDQQGGFQEQGLGKAKVWQINGHEVR